MNLDIHFRNMKGNGEITGYVDHRLSFAFSRMRHEVESLSVTLTDINGPKSGVDKQCRIVLKPVGLRQIVITERRDDIRQAIDRSIARASQALNRKLRRRNILRKKIRHGEKPNSKFLQPNWALSDAAKSISL